MVAMNFEILIGFIWIDTLAAVGNGGVNNDSILW